MSHIPSPASLLNPTLAASLTAALLAALPPAADADPAQQRSHHAGIIEQLDGLRARDLSELALALQVVLDLHHAMQCFGQLARLDPASRQASQMRRDALAMQRGVAGMTRALHKAQARRLDANGNQETGRPRPAKPPRAPRPEDGWLRELPDTEAEAEAEAADPPPAMPPGGAALIDLSQLRSRPFDKLTPKLQAAYNANPSLKRLRERWDDLPRWEEMSMEERRETFGYEDAPPEPADDTKPDDPTAQG